MQGFYLREEKCTFFRWFYNLVTSYRRDICLFLWLELPLLLTVELLLEPWRFPEVGSEWGPSASQPVFVFSLPQSQGDSSKNSVVSSNSTKDSSMSSSAPMVPQFFYFPFFPPSHLAFDCIISIFQFKFSFVSTSVFFFVRPMWSENFSAENPASFSSFILGLFAFPSVMLVVDLLEWKPCVWCIGGGGWGGWWSTPAAFHPDLSQLAASCSRLLRSRSGGFG